MKPRFVALHDSRLSSRGHRRALSLTSEDCPGVPYASFEKFLLPKSSDPEYLLGSSYMDKKLLMPMASLSSTSPKLRPRTKKVMLTKPTVPTVDEPPIDYDAFVCETPKQEFLAVNHSPPPLRQKPPVFFKVEPSVVRKLCLPLDF